MGFMDTLAQKTGNIEKAYIVIYDKKTKDLKHDAAVRANKGYGFSGFSTNGLDLPKPEDLGAIDTELGAQAVMRGGDATEGRIFGGTDRYLEVQFNPSELVVSGHGGGRALMQNYTDKSGDGGNKYSSMPVYATMSVKLIFDSMDKKESFFGDRLLSSYTEIGRTVGKGIKGALSSEVDGGVQGKVEGFIGAIRSVGSCPIRFHWGKKVCYEGILQSISGQYTMFNISGRPVRATVTLTMVLMDENRKKTGSTGVEEWRAKYYEEAFGKGAAAGSSGYSLASHGNKYIKY